MSDLRPQRRLAAILAADVVGYSRLMELDEVGTLATLKSRRKDIVQPLVAQHQGRVFKVTGDGIMVEFASAVNAVQCAIDLQQAMAQAASEQPDDRRIVLRIGINLGDVVVERGDLYGDGVNIAARLENAADPGGIYLSGTAYDQVRNKFEAAFEELGEQSLKNIGMPVRVYRVAGLTRIPIAVAAAPSDKPSIAVLPFTSMSGDVEQQYFSDGVTEDIITELARFRQLQVLARNSSFRYRGQDVDVQRVGRDLGVQYVVEGSVRRIGNRIRITAQLIDTATGHHVWADRFDRNEEELFEVQDQVVKTIAATLVGRMNAAATDRAKRKAPASLAAYELVLRGDALPVYRPGATEEARALFQQAIALDPTYARAYSLLANLEITCWYRDFDAPLSILDRGFELAQKAVELDPNDPSSHVAVARIHQARGAYHLTEHHYLKALELNRNSALLMAGFGDLHITLGDSLKALEYFKQARALDPFFDPTWLWPINGIAYFMARQYEEAIAALERATDPPYWVHVYLAASHAMLGNSERARHHAAETMRLKPDFSISRSMSRQPLRLASDREHLVEALRKAGLPE
ncbi:adenylate/guanylate cyclase domain-containing protein [Dongia deserti]|uniref:adenylate/guanylate cyclase domain-containing protein n=1 Tax=Dongia deserti TaxID=2268030 RepID=UPI000E64BA6B|nr:adenylate/guanylate cyclase domain-containing protein [Dongia deserti]